MKNQLFSKYSLSDEIVSIVKGVAADVIYKNIITAKKRKIPVKLKNVFLVISLCLFDKLGIGIVVDF